jgi:uncharacterized membrane protein
MKRKFFLILSLIFYIQFVDAYTLAEIYLNQDGSAVFLGKSSQEPNITGIEFENGKIFGITQVLTKKDAEIWTFSFALNDSAELRIFLPEGSELKLNSLISNLDAEISNYKNNIVVSIAGINPEISFDYEVNVKREKNHKLILSVLFLLLLVVTLFFFLRKRRSRDRKQRTKPRRKRKIDVIKKTLNEREQKIIEKLLELRRAKQSLLQRKTEIPKASFSRHIKNLEDKGIVIKTGIGRNNVIELRKEMLKSA